MGKQQETRLAANMRPETVARLEAIQRMHGMSKTEVIRRSIAVLKFFEAEHRAGRRIVSMDQDGENGREVVLPWHRSGAHRGAPRR